MRHFYFASTSICLLFALLIPPTSSYLIRQQSADIINSTCQQCAEMSTIFNYDFCVTSLQAIPVSHVVNLPGLAIVAMELAAENATSTLTTIEKMIGSKAFDPFAMDCLRDCLEMYKDAVSVMASAIQAFLSDHFDTANIFMCAVMEESETCEEGFEEKEGEVTPLVHENYNLFEISSIALCIINLVSLELPSFPC